MLSAELVDDLMRRFGEGFMREDLEVLRGVTTEDFEWHFAVGSDGPDGKVYRGAEGTLEGKRDNAKIFQDLRFNDIEYYPASDDKFVMTARVTGVLSTTGKPFNLRTIELYTVRDERISKKDVFWKQSID